jgi:hypothetical protein
MENYSINPITKQKETLDDIALEAPFTGIQAKNPSTDGIRKSSYTGRLLAMGIAALLSYLPMQQKANADLIWDITIPLNAVAPWDVDNDFGYEGVDLLRIDYNVNNTSGIGDPNNLIQFSINAGSSHGVYDAGAASGSWTATINYEVLPTKAWEI